MHGDLLRERLASRAEALHVEVPPVDVVFRQVDRERFRGRVVGGIVMAAVAGAAISAAALSGNTTPIQSSPNPQGASQTLPASGVGSRPTEEPPGSAWISLPGGAPIPGGVRTTLEAATNHAPFPVLRPQHPLASDSSLRRVWITSGAGPVQVALQYDSGILVLVALAEFKDPMAKYTAIEKEFGSSYVTRIHGAPALVLVGNIPGRAPSVDMVIGDVNIQIQGRTGPFSVDDIVEVAASVAQTSAD